MSNKSDADYQKMESLLYSRTRFAEDLTFYKRRVEAVSKRLEETDKKIQELRKSEVKTQ